MAAAPPLFSERLAGLDRARLWRAAAISARSSTACAVAL